MEKLTRKIIKLMVIALFLNIFLFGLISIDYRVHGFYNTIILFIMFITLITTTIFWKWLNEN